MTEKFITGRDVQSMGQRTERWGGHAGSRYKTQLCDQRENCTYRRREMVMRGELPLGFLTKIVESKDVMGHSRHPSSILSLYR